MTRIICVGDIHVSDHAPRNATSSYTDDIIDMLFWINEYAADNKADAIVWAGDIFHHKAPSKNSHALVLKMIHVVEDARKLGVPLWAVVGNHDISFDSLDSVHEKQPLGVLYASGLQELSGWHPTLPLFGVPWRQDWTTNDMSAWEAFAEWRKREAEVGFLTQHLAVTHAPIYPPKEAENIQWNLVPTRGEHGISWAMGQVGFLYYGHIHEDHGVFEVEGVTYANMGALSRGSLTEYNVNRQIQVAVWTEDGFEAVVVPHKPAHEVLRVAEVAEEKKDKLSLDSFLSDIGHSQLDISSTASVVTHIRERDDVDDNVKQTAIEILEEVG